MAAKIKDKDKGWKQILENMRDLAGTEVVVGLLGKGTFGASGAASVVDIGTFNEFGTRNIPARSFIGSTFDENSGFKSGQIVVAKVAFSRGSVNAALNRLGMTAQAAVQRKITTGPFEPNAPSTILQKGSTKPLIDDGDMRRAITYEVRK